MKKTIEFRLLITVEDDAVSVEIANTDDDLPVMPEYTGPLNGSVTIKDDTYVSSTTWHGSEEMWYTNYKE